jgi:hypothetical protein
VARRSACARDAEWPRAHRAGKGALDALLARVKTPAEAKLAAATLERCAPRKHTRRLRAADALAHATHALCALTHARPSRSRPSFPRSFHKQRCAAGWLTGLGSKTSGLFAEACTRAAAHDAALAAFARAASLGLVLTPDTSRRLLASAAPQARARAPMHTHVGICMHACTRMPFCGVLF